MKTNELKADPAPQPLTPLVALARRWAANDSLWTTQGMVEAALVRFWDEAGKLQSEAQPAASALRKGETTLDAVLRLYEKAQSELSALRERIKVLEQNSKG